MSSELVERLKHAHQHSQQRVLGSHIFGEAAARIEALEAENARLREVLEPFAAVAEHDIGDDETDDDIFWPISNARYSMSGRLRVGHLRAARRTREGALAEPAGEAHPDDVAVDRFAVAMKAKLARKRAEGRGGWDNPQECSAEHLSYLLIQHCLKGDPLDVGNLAMMLHQRGDKIIIDDETASIMRRSEPAGEAEPGEHQEILDAIEACNTGEEQ